MPDNLLPTVPLGDKDITRLIIGGNPFKGNSHLSPEMNADMQSYFTVDRIKKTLFDCERHGINTVQLRGDEHMLAVMREYWAESGKMHFIVMTAAEQRNQVAHVKKVARFGATAVYMHGTWVDNHYLRGDLTEVREVAKAIRDTGVTAGIGTHMPEVIEMVEEEDWDLDFYIASLYNLSKKKRESAVVSGNFGSKEHFDHGDRFKMLEAIRSTDKTCLAIKILGASRLCESGNAVREAFETAYNGIKPIDACVVGMFPKHSDQVAQNTGFVRDILR